MNIYSKNSELKSQLSQVSVTNIFIYRKKNERLKIKTGQKYFLSKNGTKIFQIKNGTNKSSE